MKLNTHRPATNTVCGWVAVDKPAGISSTAVVSVTRRAFGTKKAGHAGTLDRPASGVVAVALGAATKTIPFIMNSEKCYRFTINFGSATNTDDATGIPIAMNNIRPTDDQIRSSLALFRGNILQVPPAFSSVKIAGKRSYVLALAGENVQLKSRPLKVSRLEFLERVSRDVGKFELVCGKGGYVRSIARDLGIQLGCYGHVRELRRIWSGPFSVDTCLKFKDLENNKNPSCLISHLLPLETALELLPRYDCTEKEYVQISNGVPLKLIDPIADDGSIVWVAYSGKARALAIVKGRFLCPNRIINQPE